MKRVALVTGANRGIGRELCRRLAAEKYEVLLTARDTAKGSRTAEELGVTFHPLDVTAQNSVDEAHAFVKKKFGRLDVLINNAGILPSREESAMEAKLDDLRRGMETNCFGAFLLCQRFLPLMREKGYGRIVNVSSGMGQLTHMNGGYVGYRLAKTALNAVTRIFADETKDQNILVNSACPGWVQTDMGGRSAPRTLEQGADGIVWLATLPDDGPTGGFFRDREPMEW